MQSRNNKKITSFAASLGLGGIDDLLYFPKFIQIEPISACNAACIMCPVKTIKRDRKSLSPELFSKIVSELAHYVDWVERVTIQLHGEPLLDNELERKISILKAIGIKNVSFSTNGSLITKKRAESIVLSGVDNIDISIDGSTKQTYESIRINLLFEEVVSNVRQLIALRNSLRPSVSVRLRMTLSEKNMHEFTEFKSYWEQYLGLQDGAYGKLVSNWTNWLPDYKLPSGLDFTQLNSEPCISLWGSFPILSDGKVPLCCTDFNAKAYLGDVNVSSIREIWQGDAARRLRELHMTRGRAAVGICNDCFVWEDTTKVA